jgi:uncharacterized protein (DUF1697 family)
MVMQRYVALLRGINVGGHTVKMDALRALFEEMGLQNVATFIASGNVIFETPVADARALEERIEDHLRQSLGYDVATFVRTPSELAAIAAYRPFPDDDPDAAGNALYVAFLAALPTGEVQAKLLALQTPTDAFRFHDRELYWFLRTKLSESSLFSGAVVERTLGAPMTMRNITTVRKLAAKYARNDHAGGQAKKALFT